MQTTLDASSNINPVSPAMVSVNKISFSDIKSYWIEVNHFNDPHKKYSEFPRFLEHLSCKNKNPRRFCYGLFLGPQMIGATQLYEWEPGMVRYRTVNIRREFRGNDLGYFLIKTALEEDWTDYRKLFGWVRRSHLGWSIRHGFTELDGIWADDHIAMIKSI